MTIYKYPSKEEIDRLFLVDVEAGTLIWKEPTKYHPRMLNKEAGCARKHRNGKFYVRVKIDGVAYLRSHLIYIYATGKSCEMIDHINGTSTDDRIANLRPANQIQNAWNHKTRAKKSNLPMGVRSMKSGMYQARIAVNKSMIYLGTYETPEFAANVYQQKRKEYYGEFA